MRIPKRKWLISILLLFFCLLAFFLSFDGYIVLKGIVNGEKFHRGKPSSFWSKKIQDRQLQFSWSGRVVYVKRNEPPIPWLPDWASQSLQKIGWPTDEAAEVAFIDSPDRDFVALLLDLMKNEDPLVRRFAGVGLGKYQPVDNEVISALTNALHDEDEHVRSASERSLGNIRNGEPGLGKLAEEALREGNVGAK